MFAFDRSAIAVLAPLALLAIAVAASNYSSAPQPALAVQQPDPVRESQQPAAEWTVSQGKIVVTLRNDTTSKRH